MPLLPEKIEDHQDLLNRYAHVAVGRLWEFSGSIEDDKEKLRELLLDYANRHELECPIDAREV